jgi:hypothetical protein
MKMIAHQAAGVNLPFRLAASLSQGGEEHPAVLLIAKDFLPAIPPGSSHDRSLRQILDAVGEA